MLSPTTVRTRGAIPHLGRPATAFQDVCTVQRTLLYALPRTFFRVFTHRGGSQQHPGCPHRPTYVFLHTRAPSFVLSPTTVRTRGAIPHLGRPQRHTRISARPNARVFTHRRSRLSCYRPPLPARPVLSHTEVGRNGIEDACTVQRRCCHTAKNIVSCFHTPRQAPERVITHRGRPERHPGCPLSPHTCFYTPGHRLSCYHPPLPARCNPTPRSAATAFEDVCTVRRRCCTRCREHCFVFSDTTSSARTCYYTPGRHLSCYHPPPLHTSLSTAGGIPGCQYDPTHVFSPTGEATSFVLSHTAAALFSRIHTSTSFPMLSNHQDSPNIRVYTPYHPVDNHSQMEPGITCYHPPAFVLSHT